MALAAETLFLKKQLALYQEHSPISQSDLKATRFTLVWLSYWFDWEPVLTIVKPQTFKRWRRQGWRLLLKAPAQPGRPPIPPELQALIRRMDRENVTWSQQRIANELLLKLGLRVSPRTVRKYMPGDCVGSPGRRCQSQRWLTFIRNHAKGLMVADAALEMARRAKVVSAHIRRLVQTYLHPKPQRSSSPVKQHVNLVVAPFADFDWMRGIELPNQAEDMNCVERSPPESRLSQDQKPIRVPQAAPAARGEVHSIVSICYRKDLVCHGVERLDCAQKRANRSDSWSPAA